MRWDRGVSLIEILVSIFIIALIVAPFTVIFIQSTAVRGSTSTELKAIYTARNEMEILMSLSSQDVYEFQGVREVNDFFVQTLVTPYSVESSAESIYIIAKSSSDAGDEIRVFTPDGYIAFPTEDNLETYAVEIDLGESFFNINCADQSMSGKLSSSGQCHIEINLIDKKACNNIAFYVNGNADIVIYPGGNESWELNYDGEYTVVDKCFYRNYSLHKIQVKVFDNASLRWPTFRLENIVRLTN